MKTEAILSIDDHRDVDRWPNTIVEEAILCLVPHGGAAIYHLTHGFSNLNDAMRDA